jgi:hypothetical protein
MSNCNSVFSMTVGCAEDVLKFMLRLSCDGNDFCRPLFSVGRGSWRIAYIQTSSDTLLFWLVRFLGHRCCSICGGGWESCGCYFASNFCNQDQFILLLLLDISSCLPALLWQVIRCESGCSCHLDMRHILSQILSGSRWWRARTLYSPSHSRQCFSLRRTSQLSPLTQHFWHLSDVLCFREEELSYPWSFDFSFLLLSRLQIYHEVELPQIDPGSMVHPRLHLS